MARAVARLYLRAMDLHSPAIAAEAPPKADSTCGTTGVFDLNQRPA
jgi:hypothetical protein